MAFDEKGLVWGFSVLPISIDNVMSCHCVSEYAIDGDMRSSPAGT